ncbi:MAG: hypothetical protein FJ291_32350, partial [Planctomycetes bacterium]|nr:hypothetical protein [Planctomycetota bacterium]
MDRDRLTEAFAALKSHGCDIDSEDWSEADTRSKFIDTVVIECLGWEEPDIRRERSTDGLRLDYVLSIAQPIIVVEAKRASFVLPVTRAKGRHRVRLGSLLAANPTLHDAIMQVRAYCDQASVAVAALTNGRTYIVFLAVRTDGVRWEDGDALVFPDIFAADFDFTDMFTLLAKEAVVKGELHGALLHEAPPTSLATVLSTYESPDASIPNNALGLALEPLLETVATLQSFLLDFRLAIGDDARGESSSGGTSPCRSLVSTSPT